MPETVWEMPVAATALTGGPALTELPGRQYEITFRIEGNEGEDREIRIAFVGVAAFRCTHLPALTVSMIKAAYGKLVDLGGTPWLIESQRLTDGLWQGQQKVTLRHLQICFDDGPCYDFLCEDLQITGF